MHRIYWLGDHGEPIAKNLIKAGHRFMVNDIVAANVENAVAAGAEASQSTGAVAESCPVDVAIIDLDHRAPPEVEAGILVCISAWECKSRHLPKRALFKLKPVDVDAMMEWIQKMLEQTV